MLGNQFVAISTAEPFTTLSSTIAKAPRPPRRQRRRTKPPISFVRIVRDFMAIVLSMNDMEWRGVAECGVGMPAGPRSMHRRRDALDRHQGDHLLIDRHQAVETVAGGRAFHGRH